MTDEFDRPKPRPLTRRAFLAAASSIGVSIAFAKSRAQPSRVRWVERRERFAEGVASGDPASDSIILWTRVSSTQSPSLQLTVEVAEDVDFARVVASAVVQARASSDYTCRVLVGGLRPSRTYWYRFTMKDGSGSRVGRTRTAPAPDEAPSVNFAFVSCQDICEGSQHAYRRMIAEDERAAAGNDVDFVLHLGDFVYEVVTYPEDAPDGRRYDRRLRDLVRYADGEAVAGFHVPATLADYRSLYRAYLHDADIQDARARWPFVVMWDNHEFSWMGWQSFQRFNGVSRPAQSRKVMANQAWFEYQPARVRATANQSLEHFEAPAVKDAPIERFDRHGLGMEPNNLAAIGSLRGNRTIRWGRLLDLIITDQYSHRSEEPTSQLEARALALPAFPELLPEEVMRTLDAGSTAAGGQSPAQLPSNARSVPNFRRDAPVQTLLGVEQKAWFLEQLRRSRATWKVWGNTLGTLDSRADPQNLPPGLTTPWPGENYACFGGGGDYGTAFSERADIYDTIRAEGLTGFVTVSGDRHAFWAGLSAKALPPRPFDPVGVAFITGSVSAPGIVEAYEHRFPKEHPLRALYVADVAGQQKPAVNLLLHHGVRTCLEYQRTGDAAAARRLSNPDLAPHLSFLDMGGHGYAVLRLTAEAVECEFVCIPRPAEPTTAPDGGPLRYRVVHRAPRWANGERPRLEQRIIEGDPELAV
jgi:alkaline phosphatase D